MNSSLTLLRVSENMKQDSISETFSGLHHYLISHTHTHTHLVFNFFFFLLHAWFWCARNFLASTMDHSITPRGLVQPTLRTFVAGFPLGDIESVHRSEPFTGSFLGVVFGNVLFMKGSVGGRHLCKQTSRNWACPDLHELLRLIRPKMGIKSGMKGVGSEPLEAQVGIKILRMLT